MGRTKKGAVKNLIYGALQEPRTPVEVVRYVRETYDREVALRTIYYHITQVRGKKDPDYDLRFIPSSNGKKYCFVSKKKEQHVEQSYLQWFIEEYSIALQRKEMVKLHLLHKDLLDLCAGKIINDEQFIEFLWRQAKTHPTVNLADQNITLDIWQCLTLISQKLYLSHDPQYQYVKKLDLFFRDITLDGTRLYGIERLDAFHHLVSLDSPWLINTMFILLKELNPATTIKFSPSAGFSITEVELFLGGPRSQMLKYASLHPEDCRKQLFAALDAREKQFGKNDEGRQLILDLLDETRHFLTEQYYAPYR